MEKSSQKIGWIGLGAMGKPLCGFLLQNGHQVLINSRTKSKVEDLIEKGAEFVEQKEIAETCDIIITCVGFPHEVNGILYDQPGLINLAKSGTIIVDHSTNSASKTKENYDEFKKKGISFVDAPISGAAVHAHTGNVSILVGGDEESFNKLKPLFAHYSKAQTYFGESGKGQHAKMFAQICLANNLFGMMEALIYAHKTGLDPMTLFEALKNSGASSVAMQVYFAKMAARDYTPTFTVELFIKDLELIISECKKHHIILPGISQIRNFYEMLVANGGAQLGAQALLKTLEQINGIQQKS
jgi:3-hydroxyisobutyrate dehydrogenase